MHEVIGRVQSLAPQIATHAEETEKLGRLADQSAKLVRDAGVMRLLQPTDFGGYAAHPAEFATAVMEVARSCGSTGWVCGVGGVHPWELALFDRRVQEEIWGEDPDTWVASPYMPSGVATPTDGGYRLSGRWQFSSGTDHCQWIILGALVGDAEGRPAQPTKALHVVLPRSDYTIIDDTWDVIGLCGTGSKDIVVDGAFIPDYRSIDAALVAEGEQAAGRAGRGETLYRLPFYAMFPLGITSAVIGIAEGALAAHLDYQRDRVSAAGGRIREDATVLYAISEAGSEIAASRAQLIDGISSVFELCEKGESIDFAQRAVIRRNQIRCAWRAVAAVDEIFARSGGNVVRRDNVLQRFWRDAHVGLQHAIHVPGTAYQAAAVTQMGLEPASHQRIMI